MGRRGPPKTPTPILKARGSWRGAARGRREIRPPRELPRCPKWLDDEARACWKEIVPQLDRLGVLSRLDRQALVLYCRTWSRWRAADEFIRKHGATYPVRSQDGKVRCVGQFPEVAMAQKLLATLLQYQREYGLTAASRAGLAGVQTEPFDKRTEFEILAAQVRAGIAS